MIIIMIIITVDEVREIYNLEHIINTSLVIFTRINLKDNKKCMKNVKRSMKVLSRRMAVL